ncbi:hypothetical protein QCE63_20200 [Caballeronia sp. LZ065]|uniref:hypothetical protein n=1 Tax=Caballeronia sp. LZ065 TaxID=3038571 RepID=UPI002857AA89|nr:hypothetical protein [Caballeronia sp. LZ065]MDR5781724.1 hypothetical protein [Caballeronia sp. LZ065]
MKATFLYAAAAAVALTMSAAVQAQDTQMAPDSGAAQQQTTQSNSMSDMSYGGTMSTSKASGSSRDAWTPSTNQACVIGLSCNIYSGQ